MKASTHTEVYRGFTGQLRRHPLRPLILARAAIRLALKRKLPALLLYSPIAITCIIASFTVYFGFALSSGEALGELAETPQGMLVGGTMAEILGTTVQTIFQFLQNTSKFVLILMAWYGAGLINEDKRLGANLLYFSRPITRAQYLAGKFLAASWFGFLALIVPCLIICLVAAFSSPDWTFLKQEWETIPQVICFGALWISTMSLVVLTLSSITQRRTHALVASVGLVYGSSIISAVLSALLRDDRITTISLFANMERVGEWIFGVTLVSDRAVSAPTSLAALGVLWTVCLFLLTERVRKLEVVA